MKQLRTLKSFQIFKSETKKSKTYSGRCPFQGLSNGTTLMHIQSGWMLSLMVPKLEIFDCSDFHNFFSMGGGGDFGVKIKKISNI